MQPIIVTCAACGADIKHPNLKIDIDNSLECNVTASEVAYLLGVIDGGADAVMKRIAAKIGLELD